MKKVITEGNYGKFYMIREGLIKYASEKGKTLFFIYLNNADRKGEMIILTPDYETMAMPDPPDYTSPGIWKYILHKKQVVELTEDWMKDNGLLRILEFVVEDDEKGDFEFFIEYDPDTEEGQFILIGQ